MENPEKKDWLDYLSEHFIYSIVVLALVVYSFTYLESGLGLPIRSDGEGYYMYLPSFFIHGDLTLEEIATSRFQGDFPDWTFTHRWPETGKWLNQYNLGTAISLAPFFFLAHILTWVYRFPVQGVGYSLFNYPMDGYSFFYQHAAGLAGVFYFLVGVVLLKKALAAKYRAGIAIAALFGIIFGTNLFQYGTSEGVTSHALTFMLQAAVLFQLPGWHEHSSSKMRSIMLGITLGALVLNRVLNVLFLIVVPLYGLFEFNTFNERMRFLGVQWRRVILVAFCAGCVFFIQMLYWQEITGHFVVRAYRETLKFNAPHFFEVFFSLKKGMLTWFPMTGFAMIGFYYLWRERSPWFWPVVVYFSIYITTIASFFVWWGGGGFGNRYWCDLWSVMAFPMASFLSADRRGRWKGLIGFLVLGCVAYTLFLAKLYYTREISIDGFDDQAFFDVFWVRKEAMLNWLGR